MDLNFSLQVFLLALCRTQSVGSVITSSRPGGNQEIASEARLAGAVASRDPLPGVVVASSDSSIIVPKLPAPSEAYLNQLG